MQVCSNESNNPLFAATATAAWESAQCTLSKISDSLENATLLGLIPLFVGIFVTHKNQK